MQHPAGRPALVFQNPEHQFTAATVRREFAGSGADASAVDALLHDWQLDRLADRSCFRLSGGQQRRVSLGSVLLGERSVVLADEPTWGLDRIGTDQVRVALRHAARQGRAVLFTCHDLRFVLETADRLLLITDGTLFADGPPAELLGSPSVLAGARLRLPPSLTQS